MLAQKTLFYSLLFTAVAVINFSPAFAKILFQDNFDNSPDWQSHQTVNKSVYPDGYDISWGQSRADKCTTLCPPQGWTSYRAASSHWTDDRRKDTYILSTEGARGGSGKGITYNVEVSGYFGTWSGGSLDIWLGEAGYKELYVRYYIKFGSSWKWTNSTQTSHLMQKLIRISTFNDNIWETDVNPQQYGSQGLNWPVWLAEVYYNKSYPPAQLSSQVRQAPDYNILDTVNDSNALIPTDGQWHSYEFHVKMNSAPDVADGIWGFYIDGVLKSEKNDIVWKKTGSDLTHDWNWLMLLDNVTTALAPLEDHVEMPLYMDDVVVSTSYIGPDDQTIHLNKPTF